MLLESNGSHLIEAHVFFSELLNEPLDERFCRFEDTRGSEEPDPVHQRIHRYNFVKIVQAL